MVACRDGHVAAVELLLEKGAKVNATNDVSVTSRELPHRGPCSSSIGSVWMVGYSRRDECLLCPPDAVWVDAGLVCILQFGSTALMYASRYGRYSTAAVLLDWGASVNMRDDVSPLRSDMILVVSSFTFQCVGCDGVLIFLLLCLQLLKRL